ncbi:hypothetical protein OIDMADRAFT_36718 [Oidiodendron maius Zn]|uniref:Uncharacterized protein n=1 Tax=Oidiodendron maius (strain Zn) TaxID=913774 RepID=A0A0C3DY68_OIDMZ|nr:hypothetical protein OIDMADRAFT_36718 [Oidiodendron maius Zn]
MSTPGFKRKVNRHCARFWWAHLLVVCSSILIISLCLVYVAVPNIAQSGINDSSFEVSDLKFINPAPNSINLTQIATLYSPSRFTPTLDPFSAGLWLVTNKTYGTAPFVYLDLPQIHVLHPKSNVTSENQVVPLLNTNEITDYVIAMLTQENVTIALTGTTKLHEGKLPVISINYNSTTTYKGLNGLKGFNATDLKFNPSAPTGTPNLVGNAFIPNPSIITVHLGNVTLILSTAKYGVVGNATINDLTLYPGDNNVLMSSIVDQTKVVESMDASSGIVTVEILGNSSVYNGKHIPYYEKALSRTALSLDINLKQVLADRSKASM